MVDNRKKFVRILIIDDHAVVRRGLRMVLNLRPEFEIVGEAGTAIGAVQRALDLQPHLILLDLILPDGDGVKIVPELQQMSPSSKILVLSGVQSVPLVQRAVDAGVNGYVPKEVTPDELVAAIGAVMVGETYLHPLITSLLLKGSESEKLVEKSSLLSEHRVPLPTLTKREREVLALMATTATNREIAIKLSLGEETIRSHVKSVLRKLNQSNRTQAVVEGLRLGLIVI